jgi:enoyl-CoA hydratase
MPFRPNTLRYETRDRRAYITLNRPERLNAITTETAREIADAVACANDDDGVRVIVVQGAGRAFSAGYDLKLYAEGGEGHQGEVWDPLRDYRLMRGWRCRSSWSTRRSTTWGFRARR